MKAEVIHAGPWQILVKVKNCLCEDGKRRVAVPVGQPDTMFSQPARIKAFGKTVTGFITVFANENGETDYKFTAYSYRKNGNIFGNN